MQLPTTAEVHVLRLTCEGLPSQVKYTVSLSFYNTEQEETVFCFGVLS